MEHFDHVVVGGGIIGASTAYHLTRKKAGKVLLLERNELASAASSRAAGLVMQVSAKPSKTPLANRTIRTVPVLEEELGESVGFHNVGSFRITASERRATELASMVEYASRWGIPVEWTDANTLGRMIPWLDTSHVHKAAFFPTDGYVDPYILSMSYIKAAQARGAVVRPRTEVHDVLMERQEVTGVLTDAGRISCGTVIDACGVWSALLSAQVGYLLPLAPVRSHYWVAEPDAAYGGEHPVTTLPDAAAYTRPEVGGLVLGVQETHSATFDARELPSDPAAFSPTDGEEHWDVLVDAYKAVAQFFPGIKTARFSSYICGLSSYTPDGEIVLGAVPDVSGFFAATGACGSGIALSAGIGNTVSDLVLGRPTEVDITPYRPDRFGNVDPFGESFRERCASARASKIRTVA